MLGALVLLAIPAGWLAWWLGSPLVLDRTVEEAFPLSSTAVIPDGMTLPRAEVERYTRGMATDEAELLVERMSGEDGAVLRVAQGDVEAIMAGRAAVEEPADEGMPEMGQAAAVALLRGEFRDADSFHRGSGTAVLYALPDGSTLLRLEDLRVTNGPDLHVLLSAHHDPTARQDVMEPGYISLGQLKGNIGNQNYPVPPDVDATVYRSVVIYCKPFHVIFSIAPLEPT